MSQSSQQQNTNASLPVGNGNVASVGSSNYTQNQSTIGMSQSSHTNGNNDNEVIIRSNSSSCVVARIEAKCLVHSTIDPSILNIKHPICRFLDPIMLFRSYC